MGLLGYLCGHFFFDKLHNSVGFVELNVPGFDANFSRREAEYETRVIRILGNDAVIDVI